MGLVCVLRGGGMVGGEVRKGGAKVVLVFVGDRISSLWV